MHKGEHHASFDPALGCHALPDRWGQPWANVSLKTLALSVIEDELTLAVDSGVFNEPITGLMVYVPNSDNASGHKGVFISDQRNPEQPLIIVAENFQMLKQFAII